jgi:TonB family protein
MPPRLEGEAIDSAPYARAAGLAAGTGATVVLRLEILDSGEVGRVEVEVSGGADAIDQAAIAYVRVLPWAGGMIDGRPASMWIRWGVRLQSQLVNGLKQRR